jgi:molybdate transport system substrate-binding protein
MQRAIRLSLWATILCCALLSAGCRDAAKPSADPTPEPNTSEQQAVTVLVAASTTSAIDEIAQAFTRDTGIEVRISSGPSNALANQIIAGAPADVFLSANSQWAAAVEEKSLAEKVQPLLTNDLVLVTPRDNPANITSPEQLLSENVGKLALAGEAVPAGQYAQQALTSLKIYEQLVEQNKIVRGHDVRVTLTFVERGEVDAAIVYSTDSRVSDKVREVYAFDSSTHDPIVYPAVLLKAAAKNAAAKQFYERLFSSAAVKIFTQHGFKLLSANEN